MRKAKKLVAMILCVAVMLFVFGACGDDGMLSGKYYTYVDGEEVEELCFEFSSDGTWETDYGSGTYTIEEDVIIMQLEYLGEEYLFMEGVIENGEITSEMEGMEIVLKK